MMRPGDRPTGSRSQRFASVLFLDSPSLALVAPEFFRDLNLDQVVDAVVVGREGYDLKPFFYTPVSRAEVRHRQEVMRDLEDRSVFGHVTGFAVTMQQMGQHVRRAAKLRYRYQQEAVFLEAGELYVQAVAGLSRDLDKDPIHSGGLRAVRDYLTGYVASAAFKRLAAETAQVRAGLAGVRYCLNIDDNRITVSRYDDEVGVSNGLCKRWV